MFTKPAHLDRGAIRGALHGLGIETKNLCEIHSTPIEWTLVYFATDAEGNKIIHDGELARLHVTIPTGPWPDSEA